MNFPGPDMPRLSAKFISAEVGSDPGDSTNSSGVLQELSAYAAARSKAGGCVNLAPSEADTNCSIAGTSLSGRSTRSSTRRWKLLSELRGTARKCVCVCV